MAALLSGLPLFVDDFELTARFILTRSHFRKSDNQAKPEAFIPHPYLDLSVSRISGLNYEEVRHLGQLVAVPQEKALYGWAVNRADEFRRYVLEVEADEPPVRHANIRGWPHHSDRAMQKAAQKAIAQKIAGLSITSICPES